MNQLFWSPPLENLKTEPVYYCGLINQTLISPEKINCNYNRLVRQIVNLSSSLHHLFLLTEIKSFYRFYCFTLVQGTDFK